jgi:hypothetical protein
MSPPRTMVNSYYLPPNVTTKSSIHIIKDWFYIIIGAPKGAPYLILKRGANKQPLFAKCLI